MIWLGHEVYAVHSRLNQRQLCVYLIRLNHRSSRTTATPATAYHTCFAFVDTYLYIPVCNFRIVVCALCMLSCWGNCSAFWLDHTLETMRHRDVDSGDYRRLITIMYIFARTSLAIRTLCKWWGHRMFALLSGGRVRNAHRMNTHYVMSGSDVTRHSIVRKTRVSVWFCVRSCGE